MPHPVCITCWGIISAAIILATILAATPAAAHDGAAVAAALRVQPGACVARGAACAAHQGRRASSRAARRARARRYLRASPPPHKVAQGRLFSLSTNLLGVVQEGVGADLEIGRAVSVVLRGRYLGDWPHLTRAMISLGSSIVSPLDEDETSFRSWLGVGGGLRVWIYEDLFLRRRRTITVDRFGNETSRSEATYAQGAYLELGADVARATSSTEGRLYNELFLVPQIGAGWRMYLGRRWFISAGFWAGPLIVLSQDGGRELRRGNLFTLGLPFRVGFMI